MAELLSPGAMDALAHELGVDGIVAREGWGGVPSRQCGQVVQVAVRLAEEAMTRRAAGGPRQPITNGRP